jgi:hypothetical protein
MEQLSRSVLCVFELIGDHLNALVSLALSVEFFNDFSSFEIEINQTILIHLVDKKHRAFVIVEKQVLRFENVAVLVFERGHVH